ncbi:hypothetical protein RB595_007477 [Gaeumannomyces hyphopodioides]
MRFADIVIDLASVLSASRSVASKHVALRRRQIDRYSRTSSILKGGPQPRPQQQRQGGAPPPPDARKHGGGATTRVEPTPERTAEPLDAATPTSSPRQPDAARPIGNETIAKVAELVETSRETTPRVAIAGDGPGSALYELRGRLRELGADAKVADKVQSPVLRDILRGSPVSQDVGAGPARAAAEEEAEEVMGEKVPEGVDINIFRTRRGSRILRSLKSRTERQVETGVANQDATPETSALGSKEVRTQAHISTHVAKAAVDSVGDVASTETTRDVSQGHSAGAGEAVTPEPVEILQTSPPAPEVTSPAVSEIPDPPAAAAATPTAPTYQLRESKVPASRLSRLWNYGGLAAGMLGGALTESISRGFGGGSGEGSAMLSPANMERLVAKLSRMRGAALKMGQVMSFQDAKVLPGPIREVLQRVQDRADYMPAWQRDRVLAADLGPEWRALFGEFEETPIAAASIGQVHRATLKSSGRRVAVKVQFPGVADSINSDLDNLAVLLNAASLLPKGLYLDKTIANARTELAWECDYEREAECARRYRDMLAAAGGEDSHIFAVPEVFAEASGRHVLTMEFMDGVGVTRTVASLSREQRDWIGTQILRLCLREITEFRFMQTDPNWTNFLYNAATGRLELLDFGASREYPPRFVSLYVRLLLAASRADGPAVKDLSERLGYLTGHESRAMLEAHTRSVLTLAEPFLASAPDVYDFSDQTITERVKGLIPVMIRERLAPPPEETYSLHRKLSGAFLLCARLGSRVRCRDMFERSVERSGVLRELEEQAAAGEGASSG